MSEPLDSGDPPAGLRLTTAEWGMWQAFRNGSEHDLRSGTPELDDPNGDHEWGPRRTVRARVVALLLLHGPSPLLGRVASLQLTGAYITGRLDLSGGTVEPYVEFKQCRFEDEVLLHECRLVTARLVDCHIPRLEAARMSTEGDLHLPRCTVPGGVRLTDASIGTDLLLNEMTVGSGHRMRSFSADGIQVAQDLQASLVLATGEVGLRGAEIGGSLFMYGSVLRRGSGQYALYAPQMRVEHFAHFASSGPRELPVVHGATPPDGTAWPPPDGHSHAVRRVKPFECTGGMKLDDGKFGDSLVLDEARFHLSHDQELSLRRVQTPELCFTPERPADGRVVLAGASVDNLVDRVESWPVEDGLWMAGFTYQNLIPRGRFTLAQRIQWLATATPEYAPEPYEQLATVMRNSGEDADARAVLLEKQRRRRETLPPAAKLWGYLQDWTVAYGYRPGQAALWMAVVWASGTLYFARRPPEPLRPGESPYWSAPLYVLDLLLPVIDLGQSGQWKTAGAAQWTATALILLGWVLATTVAAGATRLLRRQ
ncbi:oxidoreductase [Streptomyces carminius]|uniref:Oxidoreductase n=1 Tax=Streptomyces carminius TaxID=2665496 RepID=A0A2M8M2S5_9ACTN|nr:oxidoreductase [Streptomyces carminius]PJE98504.1 oxidoreductase [Streptomyces carminius]